MTVVLVCALASHAASEPVDPFTHYQISRFLNAGVAAGAVIAGITLYHRSEEQMRKAGRQMALLGLIEGVAAAAGLVTSTQAQLNGMSETEKADEFRRELQVGMLVDFVFLSAGIIILQHGTSRKSIPRGIQYVVRGAFQLCFGIANYGLSLRHY
jgi:hypothetical protein